MAAGGVLVSTESVCGLPSQCSYTHSVLCVVHGFRQWQYSVLEGKSVHIEFERDIKGQSRYPRLGVPLLGAITAKGYTAIYNKVVL